MHEGECKATAMQQLIVSDLFVSVLIFARVVFLVSGPDQLDHTSANNS